MYFRNQIQLLKEKVHFFSEIHETQLQQFKGISSEALRQNNDIFLQLAQSSFEGFQKQAYGKFDSSTQSVIDSMKPIRETLEKFEGKMQEMEQKRIGADAALKQQLGALLESEQKLRDEAANLVQALRRPSVRGRWGELQLRRVVEMAGMVRHCDFYEQTQIPTEEGALRPDLIIRMPGKKQIIVDAKAPLEAYLNALDSSDEEARRLLFQNHARQIRQHLVSLSRKSYWSQFPNTPEFVILFLPGEPFFSAALEHDPELIEYGVAKQVILATPTTLIALLRVVAYGWKQESLSEYAEHISLLGKELYKRIADMSGHWARVGKSLGGAVQAYNKAIASLEARVLVTARRFHDLKTDHPLDPVEPIDHLPRELRAEEMAAQDGPKAPNIAS